MIFIILAPNPPTNLSIVELNVNSVLVRWVPPLDPSNLIKGFRIYFSPPSSIPIQQTTLASQENFFKVNYDFQIGVNYTFWMTTLTSVLESENSESKSILIEVTSFSAKNFTIKSITNSSAILMWDSFDKNTVWFITISCKEYFKGWSSNITTSFTVATVNNLSPGVKYQFQLFPIINGSRLYDGISNLITVTTKGVQLPKVKSIKYTVKQTTFNLAWESPIWLESNNIPWKFGVYLGLSENNLKLSGTTNNTNIMIDKLHACETYIMQIRVIEPFGIGPASKYQLIDTEFDPLAPPKNLSYKLWPNSETKYILSWNASCPHLLQSISYIIHIYETNLKRSNWFRLAPRMLPGIEMNLTTHISGNYLITVRTDRKGSRFTEPMSLTPIQYPKLEKFSAVITKNDSLYIAWRLSDDWRAKLNNHK